MKLTEEEIFQKVADRQISMNEAFSLLERINREAAADRHEATPETPAPRAYRVSEGQRTFWLIYQLSPENYAYNVPIAFRARPDTSWRAIQDALHRLQKRHPVLGSVFEVKDGEPRQRVPPHFSIDLEKVDVSHLSEAEVAEFLKKTSHRPFDLEKGPLMRATLFTGAKSAPILLLNFHHAIFDGISLSIFLKDLQSYYFAAFHGTSLDLAPLPATYADFVEWQRRMLSGEEGRAHRQYWLQRLEGELPALELATDYPRPASPSYRGFSLERPLEAELLRGLRALSLAENTSLFCIMLTAFHVLLARYTAQDDILIGTPMTGRPETRFESIIGFFINMVVLRNRLERGLSFRQALKHVQETVIDAFVHSDYPLITLIEELGRIKKRPMAHLFQTAFYFQNWLKELEGGQGTSERSMPFADSFLLDRLPAIHQEGEFDLTLEVIEIGRGSTLFFKYNPDLFAAETIGRLASHYLEILKSLVRAPATSIGEIALLTEPERQRLLYEWNQTAYEYPRASCLPELVEVRALRHPDTAALQCENRVLTYAGLMARVSFLATRLEQMGVRSNSLVGVLLQRSTDLLCGLLAVLEAGGVYVPLDPAFPRDRLEYMLEDSDIGLLLTQSDLESRVPDAGAKRLLVDRESGRTALRECDEPPRYLPANRAYVIYTSGSTGKPKGVEIGHRSLVNFLWSMAQTPGCDASDRLYALTTVSFDIAGLELYLPLVTGGLVDIAPTTVARDGLRLAKMLARGSATIVQATPATWQMLLAAGWQRTHAMKILCGGEALVPELAKTLLEYGESVWNMFGPTETTIWSTVWRVRPDQKIRIGRPIANTQLFVLDPRLQPVPIGITGELYIGGDGLAEGYLSRETLTRERFIANPFGPEGSRLYRTGDLVRYLEDGSIEYLERRDSQVKLRGYRIELGEIESALKRLAGIREAVVVLGGEVAQHRRLLAFVIRDQDGEGEADYRGLADWLPDYMIPSRIVGLDDYPMTLNRKIDRKTLATAKLEELIESLGDKGEKNRRRHLDEEDEAPRTESSAHPTTSTGKDSELIRVLQHDLREGCAAILELEPGELGKRRPLGEYGFDSLRFTALSVKINETLGVEIRPTLFYERTSIEAIADALLQSFRGRIEECYPEASAADRSRPAPSLPMTGARVAQSAPGPRDGRPRPVAVIGMAGVMPGSPDLESFWENLVEGRDLTGEIPPDRWDWRAHIEPGTDEDENSARWGAFMPGIDQFDPLFFGISPREAELMDPQQRIFLQTVWTAIEDAGYKPSSLAGSKTGLFVGVAGSDYQDLVKAHGVALEAHTSTGFSHAILANRVSYLLDLHGPSEPINVACASSLLAIHRAVEAIHAGECDQAIAGGVNLILNPGGHFALGKAGMLSKSGQCRPFARGADGYVRGEGAGAVLLKPLNQALADGDHIHGVVIGTAVNHGGRTNSLTAPNPNAQAALLRTALEKAGVEATTVGYIEASANGTELGDPLEINGLKQAFQPAGPEGGTKPYSGIGTVKANIGHLETAAGIAGVLKTLLAFKAGKLPANIHLREPNPYLELENSPFYLVGETRAWPFLEDGEGRPLPRRAGISSFGFGGVNAHVLMEEPPPIEPAPPATVRPQLVILSAKNEERLREYAARFVSFLRANLAGKGLEPHPISLESLAFTLQVGREDQFERLAFIVSSIENLIEKLQDFLSDETRIDDMYRGDAKRSRELIDMIGDDQEGETFLQSLAQNHRLRKLARFWIAGVQVNWYWLYGQSRPHRVSLPTYPFQRKRYWFPIEEEARDIPRMPVPALPARAETGTPAPVPARRPSTAPKGRDNEEAVTDLMLNFYAQALKLERSEIDAEADLSDYGADSFTNMKLSQLLEERYGVSILPRTLFELTTVRELSRFLANKIAPAPVEVENPAAVDRSPNSYPLSAAQHALWFLHQMDPDNYAYNLPHAMRFKTPPNRELLEKTFDLILQRHPSLRVTFPNPEKPRSSQSSGEPESGPVQVIAARVQSIIETIDLSSLDTDAVIPRLQEQARRPFDLEEGPLIRVHLCSLPERQFVLLIVVHHIVFDGSSYGLLVNELSRIYAALSAGNNPHLDPPRATYADFVTWQKEMLGSDVGEAHWRYWKNQMHGEPPLLELAADFPRAQMRPNLGEVLATELPKELLNKARALARSVRGSLFMVLLSAFEVLLYRYGQQEDIIVGIPHAGRPQARFEAVMGYFTNMLPIRGNLAGNPVFTEFLRRIQATMLDALEHADYPFSLLVKRLETEQDPKRTPLFQACFILQSWIQSLDSAIAGGKGAEDPGESTTIDAVHESGGFDITLEIMAFPNKTLAYFKYNPSLYRREKIERIAEHYRTLLEAIAEKPETRINSLVILTPAERGIILSRHQVKPPPKTMAKTAGQLFEQQAYRTPDAIAVIMGETENEPLPRRFGEAVASLPGLPGYRCISYSELDRRTNYLARFLQRSGVGPEALIALFMERSLELTVALLGTLKAGAAYIPLDPTYPKDRIGYILSDANTRMVLSQASLAEELPELSIPIQLVEKVFDELKDEPVAHTPCLANLDNLAYAIYTSGSTGKPKGVLIPHRGLVNYCRHFVSHYRVLAKDRILQFASISFDTAAEEIYPTWFAGATLLLRPPELNSSIALFQEFLTRESITILDLPTAFWHEWVSQRERESTRLPDCLRLVIVGGEAASSERFKAWERNVGDRILWSNTYGPTEATIAATLFEPAIENRI